MIEEAFEKVLAQAELKRMEAIALAEEEYRQIVEAVQLIRGLSSATAPRLAHGTLSSVVLAAVEQMAGPFTVRDVEAHLRDLAPEVAEKVSLASVSTTLRRLVGRKLRLAEKGGASQPSTYQKVEEILKQEELQ